MQETYEMMSKLVGHNDEGYSDSSDEFMEEMISAADINENGDIIIHNNEESVEENMMEES